MNEIFIPTLHTFAMENIFTGSCGAFRFRIAPIVVKKNAKEVDMEASSIFVAIGMIFILLSYKFSNLAATLYSLSEDTADNYGKTTISVNTKLPLFVSLLPL